MKKILIFLAFLATLNAEQIEINANSFEADENALTGDLDGNVIIKNGAYDTLWANHAKVHFDAQKKPKKYIPLILIGLILFLSKDFLYNYAITATDYIQSNLFAFGNDFPALNLKQLPSDLIKLFAFLVTPYFIIKLIEEVKNNIELNDEQKCAVKKLLEDYWIILEYNNVKDGKINFNNCVYINNDFYNK